jgi:L-amino acid N-acyltransferase YncA
MLKLKPCTITAAKAYIKEFHRHHKPPVSGLFAVGVEKEGVLVGVAVIGRPVARMLSDGYTAEVTRLCTDGSKNACSMLYQAAWRACRALGYRRLITYILGSEPGTSLKAAGWKCVGEAGGGSWSRKGRERKDEHPLEKKTRWQQEVA